MDWHRLFGLLLTDFFMGTPYVVEVERDLSVQQQYLDVLVVRKGPGRPALQLPDGLNDLAVHNLLTFKSHRQPLDAWALKELLSHYVSYRKLTSPAPRRLLPEADFHLYAVCARYPHNLAGQVQWEEEQAGVYRCRWGTDVVRVVVLAQLPRETHNAPLHLFSAVPEPVEFGQGHYQQRSENTSGLLKQLFQQYRGEGLAMYTMQDFQRDYARQHLKDLTPEERLEGLPLEERLKGLLPEEIVKRLPREVVEKYLHQLDAQPSAAKRPRPRRSKRRK